MQPGSTTTALIGRQSSSMPRLMMAAMIVFMMLAVLMPIFQLNQMMQ